VRVGLYPNTRLKPRYDLLTVFMILNLKTGGLKMGKKHNVSVGLDEKELGTLVELNNELSRKSYKKLSKAETLKFAIKFTKENFNSLEVVIDLKQQLEIESNKNKFYEQSFIEFQNKLKIFRKRCPKI
jgi:hypothetical protein